MPMGKCLLCHKTKELQDSHFIGKAVYRRLGEDSLRNPFPVLLGGGTMRQSSNQMRDYVFCFDCEQIFNLQGEGWVHGRIATVKGFPLFDSLKAYTPVFAEGDYAVYDAKAISEWDCAKLLHYGAGIFFKAGVHVWESEGSKVSIDLGPDLDELRRFLLGQAAFPPDMALSISVAGNATPFSQQCRRCRLERMVSTSFSFTSRESCTHSRSAKRSLPIPTQWRFRLQTSK